jgi:hypothetical protein
MRRLMMPANSELIEQTNLAFDFIQKLYLEVSYLIKETEGILHEEEEKFVIGRPSGYGVTSRSSTGLESYGVNLWLLRKFSVFFVPEEKTKLERGQTITEIDNSLKILFLRVVLNDKDINEPYIYLTIFHNIQKKPQATSWKKFENIMGHFEYHADKIFKDEKKIDYEDTYLKIQGEIIKKKLFQINNSETIVNQLIKPLIELYRKY